MQNRLFMMSGCTKPTRASQPKPHLHTQKPCAYFRISFCHILDLKMEFEILSEATIFSPKQIRVALLQ